MNTWPRTLPAVSFSRLFKRVWPMPSAAKLIMVSLALFNYSLTYSQTELFTTIDPPPDSRMCLDVPPFDDEFGWNGTCSCVLNQPVRGFGDSLAIQGDTAAIGSSQSSSGCVNSGSISVYENIDGVWQFTADLAPDNNGRDEQFPVRISIANDVIVADSGLQQGVLQQSKLTIFTRDSNGEWQQTQQLEPDQVSGSQAQQARGFLSYAHDDDTIVMRKDGGLATFIQSTDNTWREVSLLVHSDSVELFKISAETMAIVDGLNTLTIYERTGNTWQERVQFAVVDGDRRSSLSVENDTILYAPFSFREESTVYSFSRDASQNWSMTSGVDIPAASFNVDVSLAMSGMSDAFLNPQVTLSPASSTFLYVRDTFSGGNSALERGFISPVSPTIQLISRVNDQWFGTDEIIFTSDRNVSPQIGFSSAYDGNNILLGTRDDNSVLFLGSNAVGAFTTSSSVSSVSGNTSNAVTDNCDYSNADSFNGWGWDPVAMLSCAPIGANTPDTPQVSTPQVSQCVDTDGDGFGWNGFETCDPVNSTVIVDRPQVLQCIDTDGDGFGWNGFETCDPSSSTVTVDQPQALQCIDTDGDGFGWNGFATCDPSS